MNGKIAVVIVAVIAIFAAVRWRSIDNNGRLSVATYSQLLQAV